MPNKRPLHCRACLVYQEDCFFDLVEMSEITIVMFTYCTSIEISESEPLPYVCQECVERIQTCYTMISGWKLADSTFKYCNNLSSDEDSETEDEQETFSTADIKDENIIDNNDDFKDQNVLENEDHNYALKVHNKTDSSATASSRDKVVFACDLCPKTFKHNYLLRSHKKTHDRTFKCDQCPKTFKVKSTLNRHINTHNELVDILCQICGARFTEKSSFTLHMRSHKRQKPSACILCPYKAANKNELSQHYNAYNNAIKNECPICQRGFKCDSDLSEHLKIHTDVELYKCVLCSKPFVKKLDLKCHLIYIHKLPVEFAPYQRYSTCGPPSSFVRPSTYLGT